MSDPQVSVVLPTFNERGSILKLVETIHLTLEPYRHEIIVVDDNSPDGTYDHVKAQSAAMPYLKALLRTSNPSLGGSLGDGVAMARGEFVILMDSDFNHPPRYLPIIVENLKYYDCVCGSRFVYGGSMNQRLRHLLSWIFNVFVRVITWGQITDNLYGFIGIRRTVLAGVDSTNVFWGYGDYCIRLLFYLQQMGVEILQIPVQNGAREAGVGNSRFFRTFVQYTVAATRLAYRERLLCTLKSKDAEFVATKPS